MGWDTRLILKGNKTKEQLKGVESPGIYCDRGYHLINKLTEYLGVADKLQNDGLTKKELCDILCIIIDIRRGETMADVILKKLQKYNDTDVFILADWDYCL